MGVEGLAYAILPRTDCSYTHFCILCFSLHVTER